MRDMTAKSQGVFGLPDKWKFDYPWSMVKIGFWLWMVSGFERLPTQKEVMEYDPRWITDMQFAYQIHSFYKTDSPLFDILRQAEENEGEIDFKARKQAPDRDKSAKNYDPGSDMDSWVMFMNQAQTNANKKSE